MTLWPHGLGAFSLSPRAPPGDLRENRYIMRSTATGSK